MVKLRAEDLEDGDTITAAQFRDLVGADEGSAELLMEVNTPAQRNRPEQTFQREVQEFARANEWIDWHVLRSKGMRAGFPDLVLLREPDCLWIELKAPNGKVTTPQKEMHDMLRACGQTIYVWKPEDWDEIIEVLK
jgi:hypothetical protein